MNTINANDFVLYISVDNNQLPICTATSLSIQLNAEQKEAVPDFVDDGTSYGLWRQFYYGIKDYSLSISGNVSVISDADFSQILVGLGNNTALGSEDKAVSLGQALTPTQYGYFTLEDALFQSQFLSWQATDGNIIYSGKVMIPTLTHSSDMGDINRFTGSLVGCGKINRKITILDN